MSDTAVRYLGGHPALVRSAEGALRIDSDANRVTFHEAIRSDNPVDLSATYEERFTCPVADLTTYQVGESNLLGALAAAARGSILLGVWGAAGELETTLDRAFVLTGTVGGNPVRMSFLANSGHVAPFLAALDASRLRLGLAALDESPSGPTDPGEDWTVSALQLIAQRLDDQGRALAEILDRLPPRP